MNTATTCYLTFFSQTLLLFGLSLRVFFLLGPAVPPLAIPGQLVGRQVAPAGFRATGTSDLFLIVRTACGPRPFQRNTADHISKLLAGAVQVDLGEFLVSRQTWHRLR